MITEAYGGANYKILIGKRSIDSGNQQIDEETLLSLSIVKF
jgi:hypothetical protein